MSILLKAKEKQGIVKVKCLIRHDMNNGFTQSNITGEILAADFIKTIIVKAKPYNQTEQIILEALWSGSISSNPYLSFEYKGLKGDALEITWVDYLNNSDSKTVKVR